MNDAEHSPPKASGAGEGEDWTQRAARYDPRRAQARLALIEQQVTLAHAVRERDEILARQAPPIDPGDPLEVARLNAEKAITDAERWAGELIPLVGDPETVVDEHGWLPSERRAKFLSEFAAKFNAEVSDLHERLPALRAELKVASGRKERATIREEMRKRTARLAYLEAVPPFTAADMCSECPWPMTWHDLGVTFCLTSGATLSQPCDAWPVWRQTLTEGLLRVMDMMQQKKAPPAPPPIPKPLAVIPSGASVEETNARLTAVQAEHPKAQVRRGKGNCWEIWATPAPK